jgi:hypothetical protein
MDTGSKGKPQWLKIQPFGFLLRYGKNQAIIYSF